MVTATLARAGAVYRTMAAKHGSFFHLGTVGLRVTAMPTTEG
jgi:hypothetical protein